MSGKLTGRIFDIQGFSVHDGPGIRTTVFFKGCPLRCRWCHSPESQQREPQICWLSHKCTGCGRCIELCPQQARFLTIEAEKPVIHVDHERCRECGECIGNCRQGAAYTCGLEYTVDELMERIESEKLFYRRSGGGVTTSGGECLVQIDFVEEFLRRCQEAEVNTAVDTCGAVPWEYFERVLPYTDLFLYDVKAMDPVLHRWGVGMDNELILSNLRRLVEAGGKVQIRIPVIPGFNDGEENMTATRDLVCELRKGVTEVQLLPYHNLGLSKWGRLSETPPDLDTHTPDDTYMKQLQQFFLQKSIPTGIH